MKQVSFNVAKALKGAGYPQDVYGHHYYLNGVSCYGVLEDNNIFAPTYIDAWLWLWREKKITLLNVGNINNEAQIDILQDGVFIHTTNAYPDPEEAIKQAIKYLVENNLLK